MNQQIGKTDRITAFFAYLAQNWQKKAQEERTLVSVATTMSQNSLSAKKADKALKRFSKSRCNSYDGWLNVGMALYHEFGGADWARVMSDNWSKQSDAYEVGATKTKWETFQKGKHHKKLGLGSLILWANSDDPTSQEGSELVGLDALLAKIHTIAVSVAMPVVSLIYPGALRRQETAGNVLHVTIVVSKEIWREHQRMIFLLFSYLFEWPSSLKNRANFDFLASKSLPIPSRSLPIPPTLVFIYPLVAQ